MDGVDPVVLLATTDPASREVIGSELRRRYGGDYEVVVCADYAHARAVLEGLRRWNRQVALVIGCYGPGDREGLDFLKRAHALQPSAKRVVAAVWGDFASTPAVFSAIAHGHAELLVLRPERPRDEELLAGARSVGWSRARLAVWAVLAFTTITLIVTLIHLDKFHLGAEQPTSARIVTWGWLAIYAGVPVAMIVALGLRTRSRAPESGSRSLRRPLPAGLRLLLTALAAVLLVAGAALLAVPASVADAWAWPLTELTARAVGAWLVGLGWAAAHARLIDDVAWVQPLGLTGVTFVLLESIALLRYGEALDWTSAQALAYLALLAGIGGAAGWILLLGRGRSLRAADAGARARTR